MAEALAGLDLQVVDIPAKYTLQTSYLFEVLTDEDRLFALVDSIREDLGESAYPL